MIFVFMICIFCMFSQSIILKTVDFSPKNLHVMNAAAFTESQSMSICSLWYLCIYLLSLKTVTIHTIPADFEKMTPTFVYIKTTHKNETVASPTSIKGTSSINYIYVSVSITWAFPVGKVHLFIDERTHRSQINRSECLKIEVTSSYHVSAFSHIHSRPLVQLGSVLKCGFIEHCHSITGVNIF